MRCTSLVLPLVLAACGPSYSPNTYSTTAMQRAAKVERAVVVGVRDVHVSASGNVGAATGAAAGGVLGATVPGTNIARALTGIGGGLVGGLVGAGAEHAGGDTTAYEYILREDKGDLVSVTQRDKVPLALGQRVLVIAGPEARVVPDYTAPSLAQPETPAPPAKSGVTALPLGAPAAAPGAIPLPGQPPPA